MNAPKSLAFGRAHDDLLEMSIRGGNLMFVAEDRQRPWACSVSQEGFKGERSACESLPGGIPRTRRPILSMEYRP